MSDSFCINRYSVRFVVRSPTGMVCAEQFDLIVSEPATAPSLKIETMQLSRNNFGVKVL